VVNVAFNFLDEVCAVFNEIVLNDDEFEFLFV
jgi:hypothetical protein